MKKLPFVQLEKLLLLYQVIRLYEFLIDKWPGCKYKIKGDFENILKNKEFISDIIGRKQLEWGTEEMVELTKEEMRTVDLIMRKGNFDNNFKIHIDTYDSDVLFLNIVSPAPWFSPMNITVSIAYSSEYLVHSMKIDDLFEQDGDFNKLLDFYNNLIHHKMIYAVRKKLLQWEK
jgi:hypothetical protein